MLMLRPPLLLVACGAFASSFSAQGAPEPGHRLFCPISSTTTYLLDAQGSAVHSWTSAFPPGVGLELSADGSLLRTINPPGGYDIGGEGGGIQRLAFDGSLVWDYSYDGPGVLQHHDIEELPNGNVLMIAWEEKTAAQAIAAGRNPALLGGPLFLPEHVVELLATGPTTGAIVWEWHLWDHLIQDFDPSKANHGVVADHPELVDINFPPTVVSNGDWIHMNAISHDAEHDWIILGAPFQGEVWIIDHATTTAEAAGPKGDLLYRWGNPAAYDRGLPADQQLFNHHGTSFIAPGLPGAGHVLLFNNQAGPNWSEVWELELPLDAAGGFVLPPGGAYGPVAPAWSYVAPTPSDLYSPFLSSAQRTPAGHTLVCSGVQAKALEIDASGVQVWSAPLGSPTFQTHYLERTLWSEGDSVSTGAGGGFDLELVAGSQHAGELFLMLGSLSGTSPGLDAFGLHLPLNPDVYLFATLNHPTAPPLVGNLGLLDPLGRATLQFLLPAGVAAGLAGATAHHAYALLDLATLTVTHASNAVPVALMP